MADRQLTDYIAQNLRRGANVNDIRNILLKQGWMQQEVDEAIGIVRGPPKVSMPVPPPQKPAQSAAAQPAARQAPEQAQPRKQARETVFTKFNFPFILSIVGGLVMMAAAAMAFMAGTSFVMVPLIEGILLNSIFGLACSTIVLAGAAMLLLNRGNLSAGIAVVIFAVIMAASSSDKLIVVGGIASAIGGILPIARKLV